MLLTYLRTPMKLHLTDIILKKVFEMWNKKKKNVNKKVSPIKQDPLKRPGRYLWHQIMKKTFISMLVILAPIFIWIGMLLGILLASSLKSTYAVAILVSFIPIWLIVGTIYVKRVEPELENLYLGFDGEVFMGEVLDSLKEKGCKIIHDFAYTHHKGKSNIDHIIVAPQGVFTVETKAVSKVDEQNEKIIYDGKTVKLSSGRPIENPLNQAEAEAKVLKDFIYKQRGKEISVQPIVVYPNWYIINENNQIPRKVFVWTHKYFANNIPEMPVILKDEEIISIYEALAEHNRNS